MDKAKEKIAKGIGETAQEKEAIQNYLNLTEGETIRGIWRGCCHYCNRATSVAGLIGDDGLCSFCYHEGYKAWW